MSDAQSKRAARFSLYNVLLLLDAGCRLSSYDTAQIRTERYAFARVVHLICSTDYIASNDYSRSRVLCLFEQNAFRLCERVRVYSV